MYNKHMTLEDDSNNDAIIAAFDVALLLLCAACAAFLWLELSAALPVHDPPPRFLVLHELHPCSSNG